MKQYTRFNVLLAITFILFITPAEAKTDKDTTCRNVYFSQAFAEISDMLSGKSPLSIKRAVFLIEWAYLDGKLDYENYSNQIDSTAAAIIRFVEANNLDKIPTGKNVAFSSILPDPTQ